MFKLSKLRKISYCVTIWLNSALWRQNSWLGFLTRFLTREFQIPGSPPVLIYWIYGNLSFSKTIMHQFSDISEFQLCLLKRHWRDSKRLRLRPRPTQFFIRPGFYPVHEKCPNTELFLFRIFLYSVQIEENTDQKKLYQLSTIWWIHLHDGKSQLWIFYQEHPDTFRKNILITINAKSWNGNRKNEMGSNTFQQ